MAGLWGILRAEVRATVDDFREKGAVGAFKDAALDTRDIAASTGGWLWSSVKDLVADEDDEKPILRAAAPPPPGSIAPLEFPDGTVVDAVVMDVDTSPEHPRARVQLPHTDEMVLVEVHGPATGLAAAILRATEMPEPGTAVRLILPGSSRRAAATVIQVDAESDPPRILVRAPAVEIPFSVLVVLPPPSARATVAPPPVDGATPRPSEAASAAARGRRPATADAPPGVTLGPREGEESGGILDVLHQEWQDTVQDFRDKGAVGAVTDAALDAVDLVRDGARTAGTAVQPLAARAAEAVQPLVESAQALTTDLLGLDDETQVAPERGAAAGAVTGAGAGASVGAGVGASVGAGADAYVAPVSGAPVAQATGADSVNAGGSADAAVVPPIVGSSAVAGSSVSSSSARPTPRQSLVAERSKMFEKSKKEEEEFID